MRLIWSLVNEAIKCISWVMMALLAILVLVFVISAISVIWAINPLAGMALLAFSLLVVRLMFYRTDI